MEVYLQSLGMGVWTLLEEGYKVPKVVDETEENENESKENHETIAPRTVTLDPQNRKQYKICE